MVSFTLRCTLLMLVLLGSGATVWSAPAVPQTPEELASRYDVAKSEANKAIDAIIAVPDESRTFDNTILAFDDMHARLDAEIGMLLFMAYVHGDPAMRSVSQGKYQDYSNWMVEMGKREDLHQAIMAYADTDPELEGEDARLLEFTLRDYRRAGMALSPEKRAELIGVEKRINELSIEFDENISADETVVMVSGSELDGMPADWIAGLEENHGLYLLGMDYPTIVPILDHSPNEDLRQKIWMARKRRAKRNVQVLEELLLIVMSGLIIVLQVLALTILHLI